MNRSCKSCRFIVGTTDSAGRMVVRNGYVYECAAPTPAMPALPYSVRKVYPHLDKPLKRAFVTGTDGADCECYAPRPRRNLKGEK